MTSAMPSPVDQKTLWNGSAGRAWVEGQKFLDEMLLPLEKRLVEVTEGARVILDVGCGTGATSLAIARAHSPEKIVGLDVSRPMLDLAEARVREAGAKVEFICADAETFDFSRGGFDLVVSRFGVMFFENPTRAFANLRGAMGPGGRATLFAWRSASENSFMTAAERAAAPLLPSLPKRSADGPGQFSFGDETRVRRILEDAGWSDIRIEPLDLTFSFPASALDDYVARLGPVGQALSQLEDVGERDRIFQVVRDAFVPFVDGPLVRFVAACWQIHARAR